MIAIHLRVKTTEHCQVKARFWWYCGGNIDLHTLLPINFHKKIIKITRL
jgi:hypothetical protein